MSELRRQFRSISQKELKILIIANLDFIRDATPFPETEEIISGIRAKVEAINEMNNLQQTLLNLMKIVQYWDTHQNQSEYPNRFGVFVLRVHRSQTNQSV